MHLWLRIFWCTAFMCALKWPVCVNVVPHRPHTCSLPTGGDRDFFFAATGFAFFARAFFCFLIPFAISVVVSGIVILLAFEPFRSCLPSVADCASDNLECEEDAGPPLEGPAAGGWETILKGIDVEGVGVGVICLIYPLALVFAFAFSLSSGNSGCGASGCACTLREFVGDAGLTTIPFDPLELVITLPFGSPLTIPFECCFAIGITPGSCCCRCCG